MNGRLHPVLAFATAALLATPVVWTEAALSAQDAQGRFRVLAPRFFPDPGTNDDFGDDTAERVRDALESLPSHTALEEGEMEDALERFGYDMDDLIDGEAEIEPCLGFRQLGSQIGSEVAMCVNYRDAGDNMVELYNIQFWAIQQQQAFDIEPFTIHRNNDEEAAERIMASFDRYIEVSQYRTYCYDWARSQEWDRALRNCDLALDANPRDVSVLAQRAYIHQEQGDLERSLDDARAVLEIDPTHETALQRAGFAATTLGHNEEGRGYYSRYLELNPEAVSVRRNIAHNSYTAGDPLGAMLLVEAGLDLEPDNLNLLLDYGNYAFVAAANQSPTGQQDSEGLTPEVAELYRNAVDAYVRVYDARPDSMTVGALRNIVAANIQLENIDEAVSVAERITETHPDEASLWAIYADALRRSDDLDAAIQAMSEVERIDPDYRDLHARQGMWMLEAGRVEDAVPFLQQAVERGQNPNTMARNLLAQAHSNGVVLDDYDYAIDILVLAKESFDVGPEQRRELDFWHGYSIFQQAVGAQQAETLEAARATLPRFREARRLFEAARGFSQNGNIDINEYIGNTDIYIEIQEARIARGGG